MGRAWCMWTQLTLVAISTILARSIGITVQCNASISANQTCTVPYTSTVVLHCPVGNSFWRFGKQSVCDQQNCTIVKATSATTGSYYCCRDDSERYHVQVNVLAPPALMKVSACVTTTSSICKSAQPLVSSRSSQMKATVYYSGFGNLSVTWSKKTNINGVFKPFNCTPTHCIATSDNSNPNQQTSSIAIQNEANNPFQVEDIGYYMANVSNEYGYNTTVTVLNVTCDPRDAPLPPARTNVITPVTIKGEAVQNISCTAEMDFSSNLIMCYEGRNTSDCSICLAYTTGSCSSIETKPQWTINSARAYPFGPCKPRRTIYATIPGVQQDDSGIITCYLSSSKYWTPYIIFNVSVVYDNPPSPPLASPLAVLTQSANTIAVISSATVSAVVAVVLVLVVGIVLGCIIKRRDVKDSPTDDFGMQDFGMQECRQCKCIIDDCNVSGVLTTGSSPSSVDLRVPEAGVPV